MGARGGPRPPALTGEGIIGVEEVDLLTAIPVDVAGCDPDGVALPVPQRVVGGAALVHRDVHQPLLGPVVLQNQVGAIVPGGGRGRDVAGRSWAHLALSDQSNGLRVFPDRSMWGQISPGTFLGNCCIPGEPLAALPWGPRVFDECP